MEVALRRPPGRSRLERPEPAASVDSVDARRVPDFASARFSPMDLDDWLFGRLDRQWPGHERRWWEAKLNVLTSSNDFLFITNEHGILLMEARPHLLDAKPRALEIFAWCRRARPPYAEPERLLVSREDSVGLHAMASLYRFAREWMRGRGALYMIAGICSDMPISILGERAKGECADWVVVK